MTAKTYRRKPTDTQAIQFTGNNLDEIHAEFGHAGIVESIPEHWLILTTAQGKYVQAGVGEWIVPEKTPGRFYPVAPDVFAATYDEVSDDE